MIVRTLLSAAILCALLGAALATEARPADPTCAYMDRLKQLWNTTEPSTYEKGTLRRLAGQFQEGTVDPHDLGTLDAVLVDFAKKVGRRAAGTRALEPTAAAQNVRRLGLEFLARVDETVGLSRRLIQEMRSATPDAALIERGRDRLQRLDREVQRLGGLFNGEVVRIRAAFHCGPP